MKTDSDMADIVVAINYGREEIRRCAGDRNYAEWQLKEKSRKRGHMAVHRWAYHVWQVPGGFQAGIVGPWPASKTILLEEKFWQLKRAKQRAMELAELYNQLEI